MALSLEADECKLRDRFRQAPVHFEALARARMDQIAAAVRAPRPADLSRLEEAQKRRAGIDAHAGAFRDTVRTRLGLGEYRGPGVPTTSYVGRAMSAPLCDADMCAPQPHPALTPVKVSTKAREAVTDKGDAYTPLPEGYVAADDLELDVFVKPDGETLLLDEDEYQQLDLSERERACVEEAVAQIKKAVATQTGPFSVLKYKSK